MIAYFAIVYTMNKRHQKTLETVFRKPVPKTLEWKRIEALFIALDAIVIEGRGSRVRFELNDVVVTFHRPHPRKETNKGAVVSMRRFLTEAGVTPDDGI